MVCRKDLVATRSAVEGKATAGIVVAIFVQQVSRVTVCMCKGMAVACKKIEMKQGGVLLE